MCSDLWPLLLSSGDWSIRCFHTSDELRGVQWCVSHTFSVCLLLPFSSFLRLRLLDVFFFWSLSPPLFSLSFSYSFSFQWNNSYKQMIARVTQEWGWCCKGNIIILHNFIKVQHVASFTKVNVEWTCAPCTSWLVSMVTAIWQALGVLFVCVCVCVPACVQNTQSASLNSLHGVMSSACCTFVEMWDESVHIHNHNHIQHCKWHRKTWPFSVVTSTMVKSIPE